MDWDILKTIRETTDWLVEKYKAADSYHTKNQLNKIANQISELAVNKASYLAVLKNEISSNKEYIDLHKIHSAISIAEKDTKKLSELLNELNLKPANVSFSLKHGLEKLTKLKQVKLIELKEIVLKDVLPNHEIEKIVSELESFEQKWIDLGKEIDTLIK